MLNLNKEAGVDLVNCSRFSEREFSAAIALLKPGLEVTMSVSFRSKYLDCRLSINYLDCRPLASRNLVWRFD